jgi:methylthioribulose-1-phosphate dehydratase
VSEIILTQLAAEAARIFHLGFTACTAGNVSALLERDPLVVAMSPSGVDKGSLKPADFIRVGSDAKPLPPDGRKPSDEALLHVRLYQQVGCQAVCHGHPPHAVALSLGGGTGIDFSGIEMQKAFAGTATHACLRTLPIVENSQDMEELAAAVLGARRSDVPAVLVRGHGIYAWGRSVPEASRHLETCEWLSRVVLLCRAAGIAPQRAAHG